jgi:predicted Zn-dependent peptidase
MMGKGDKAKKVFEKTYKNLIYEDNPYPENSAVPSYEQLLEFASIYFTPANMVISVVSPAQPEKIKEHFAAFSADSETENSPVYTKRLRIHHKEQTIDKPGGGNRSYLYWGFVRQIDPADKAALQALSLILRDKIVFDIREKQGMAYHMSAGIEFKDDRAMFYINQGTRPQNVDVLLPQYPGFFQMSMLDDVTEADLEKTLNMYLGRMMFRHLSSINQGYYLGHSFYFKNDINYDTDFLARLKQVSLSDVKAVANKYMKIENPLSVTIR